MTSRAHTAGRRRGLLLAAFASLTVSVASVARGQQNCGPSLREPRSWPAPLDRMVAVQARNVTLRDGLDRLAVAGKFRLSYSAELLPLDRRVCLSAGSMVVGEGLAELLAGTGIEAVVASADQVVLTPVRPSVKPGSAEPPPVQTLERVVVTGSATGDAERSLTVALDIVDGKKLSNRASNTFASSFDGNVPGLWVWEQSPSSLLARYGSIRGASSFGLSYPKVYIDGIEVANPLLMTEMNAAVIDHVEVIRGPQGAALYGADAISGVVNVVTRHEGTQAGAERTEVVTGAGLSETNYAAAGSVFTQNHAVAWRGGSSVRSGSLALNMTSLGGYVPGAHSRDLKVNAGVRAVTSKASFTGTGRFYGKQAAVGENPLLHGFGQSLTAGPSQRSTHRALAALAADSARIAADSLPESIHQYTVGGTATVFTSGRWTPSFVAGVDGYRLANVPNDLAPLSSATDTALHAARGGADRGTLRASLVGKFDLPDTSSLTLTLAAEHSALRDVQEVIAPIAAGGSQPSGSRTPPMLVSWRTNSGLIGQGNFAFHDALYLTSGLRLERNDGFTSSGKTALLPMLGAAIVRDVGPATLKLRSAYGRGIRPVQTPVRALSWHDVHGGAAAPTLDPEEQVGTELGADLLFGRHIGVHLTRFDQTAFGLIQQVAIPRDSQPPGGYGSSGSGKPHLAYVLQNVGEISNRGWELESSANFGALSVGGGLSIVDSRVQRIARGYTGDLMKGDRMLGVPANTVGASATWNQPHWFVTMSASRAGDWINYDRLRLARDFASGTSNETQLTGARLRSYWMSYNGVTRLRATVSRDLMSGFALKLTGDNLTNVQSGEPDNITVLPGRTLLFGLSAKLR